jgi:hypothetical protein
VIRLVAAVVLSLFAAGCAATLRDHAVVAVAASEAVAGVGDVMMREMAGDYADAGGAAATPEQVAVLDKHWDPLIARYEQATAALDAYVSAIRAADKRGYASLLHQAAVDMLAAWAQLDAVADSIGVALPPPPDALVKFVGGR